MVIKTGIPQCSIFKHRDYPLTILKSDNQRLERCQTNLVNIANKSQSSRCAYGSLLWVQNFIFSGVESGYIQGFKRRFWQESQTHRGTKEKSGRVAIINKSNENEKLWGLKFTIQGSTNIEEAKQKLHNRENRLGGYTSCETLFYDKAGAQSVVLVFTATSESDLFVGPASDSLQKDVEHISTQVVGARGFAGSNEEYVVKLAHFIRLYFPEENDEHLFLLDQKVKEKLNNNVINVHSFCKEIDNIDPRILALCPKKRMFD